MCLQSLMKFHHCLFKILGKNQKVVDKELQRAISNWTLALIFLLQMFILWISVLAKFDDIPSLPVQVIKEKPKCR